MFDIKNFINNYSVKSIFFVSFVLFLANMMKSVSLFGFLKIRKLDSKTAYKISDRKLRQASSLVIPMQFIEYLPNNQFLIPILI